MCANPPGIEWEAVNYYSCQPTGSSRRVLSRYRMESQYIRLHKLRYNSKPFGFFLLSIGLHVSFYQTIKDWPWCSSSACVRQGESREEVRWMGIREEDWTRKVASRYFCPCILMRGWWGQCLHVVRVASEREVVGTVSTCGEGSFWEGSGGDSVYMWWG